MTVQERNKYREFLISELKKLDGQQSNAEKVRVE
jgi:hypothetical protein